MFSFKASSHLKPVPRFFWCQQSDARLSTELATGAQESTELKASKASSKNATETKPKCASAELTHSLTRMARTAQQGGELWSWGKLFRCVFFLGGNQKNVLFCLCCVCVFRKWCVNGWFWVGVLNFATNVYWSFGGIFGGQKRRSQIEQKGIYLFDGKGFPPEIRSFWRSLSWLAENSPSPIALNTSRYIYTFLVDRWLLCWFT